MKTRKILGSLLIAVLGLLHLNFIVNIPTVTWIGFFLILALAIWKSGKEETKIDLKHFQYKTASILSFLLPLSAIIFSMVFAGKSVMDAGSEAEQAGAAIGSAIGGFAIVAVAFVFGLMLGIVFHLMSKTKKIA